MTAPNLLNPSSIVGKTALVDLTSTSATQILSNASGSNTVLKINSLYVANVDGTAAADITITLHSAAGLGGDSTQICSTVSVPADAVVVVIEKDSFIYLEEDRSLGATAGAANDLKITCSYEEIS